MNLKDLIAKAGKQHKENNLKNFLLKGGMFLLYSSTIKKRLLHYSLLRSRSKTKSILKQIQDSMMYLDLEDDGISLDLYFDGIREPHATRRVKSEIHEGDVVVDIGANIGYYALMESQLVGDKGKLYAIEPVPENMETLKRNIEANKCRNIETFRMAIGDENKKDVIHISEKSNWHSMIRHEKLNSVKNIDVDVQTLDYFLKDKPEVNFIRMDVEGYEGEILKGMTKTLGSASKSLKLFIEIHPHIMEKEKTKKMLTTLKKFGFETTEIIKSYTPLQLKYFRGLLREYPHKTIDDLLRDDSLLCGERGAFQIFFEKVK